MNAFVHLYFAFYVVFISLKKTLCFHVDIHFGSSVQILDIPIVPVIFVLYHIFYNYFITYSNLCMTYLFIILYLHKEKYT